MRAPRLIATLALGTLLVACSSSGTRETTATAPAPQAAPAAAASTEAPAVETAKADRTVCKSIAPTGSRIARKTCRRQSEWEEMAREGRDAVGQVQRRGDQTVNPAN